MHFNLYNQCKTLKSLMENHIELVFIIAAYDLACQVEYLHPQ